MWCAQSPKKKSKDGNAKEAVAAPSSAPTPAPAPAPVAAASTSSSSSTAAAAAAAAALPTAAAGGPQRKGSRKAGHAFINKKTATTFHLVHRSQHDPLAADENASQVLFRPTFGPKAQVSCCSALCAHSLTRHQKNKK